MAITAVGLHQGILTSTQVACFFVAGLFWVKCVVQLLPPVAGKGTNWEFVLFVLAFVGIGDLNRYQYDRVPFWQLIYQVVCHSLCHLGCAGVTAFLTFWLFREVFTRHFESSPPTVS